MAQLILSMNVSVDGYVDGGESTFDMAAPGPVLFQYWIDEVRAHAGAIYGRRMYEVMRYWDEDRPEWSDPEREFARVWRVMPKWVVSQSLRAVGPNAQLITGDIEAKVRALKAQTGGVLSVSGPELAGFMTERGLIDEYHLLVRPFVLGRGKPFFHDARPKVRLISSDRIDDETMRLIYSAV